MKAVLTHMIGLAAFSATALSASPAAAAPADFQSRLDAQVHRALAASAPSRAGEASGIASVRFSVGPDGRPTDVELIQSSGRRALDRRALRTIASLDLPADAPAGEHVALLQFGTWNGASREEKARIELAEAARRTEVQLASRDDDRLRLARSERTAAPVVAIH